VAAADVHPDFTPDFTHAPGGSAADPMDVFHQVVATAGSLH
jgi:hypothetical protein